jgi:Fe-S cluster assembly ATPase SufC
MIEKPDIWVRDVLEQEGSTRYNNWKKKIDSLGHIFKSEINIMLDEYKDNFIVRDGQHPHIMTMLLQRKISLETFTIITHAANIFDYWDEKVVDKIVAGDIINKSRKYKPFLDIDMKRYKTFVKDRFM